VTNEFDIQAVGFEILYQESKGRVNVQNISPEGTNASVRLVQHRIATIPSYISGGSKQGRFTPYTGVPKIYRKS
jgi:hypothetical protein